MNTVLALVVGVCAIALMMESAAGQTTTARAPAEAPDPNLLKTPLPPRASTRYPWVPDNGDGTYKNPIICADYSDPDVCRVGDDYYLTASSFSDIPGLPILHSKDLVNWTIIGNAIAQYPVEAFKSPQHGGGVWAPAIRHHNGEFYIYYGDPDNGIYMTKAKDAAGPWEPLHLVRAAKGWIDTCPFWDDDGNAYLLHAFARSRSGLKNILHINKMSADGRQLLDEGTLVFDGDKDANHYTTIEGPKLYKWKGEYFILAPGGGVAGGYQIAFRSKTIYGPYASKIVMDRGTTGINGPHQGGWVDTPDGSEHWFIHFQEILPYGRVAHLQPMTWMEDGWPMIGEDPDKDGRGQPVLVHKKPNVGKTYAMAVPQTTDEFEGKVLSPQWQWSANFKPEWARVTAGVLRMMAVSPEEEAVLYDRPNLLLQKFPAEAFTVTTRMDAAGLGEGEAAGLVLSGKTTTALQVRKAGAGVTVTRTNYNGNGRPPLADVAEAPVAVAGTTVYLRMTVAAPRAVCSFSFSADGVTFTELGRPVTAINGMWIGAKVGVFATAPVNVPGKGTADFEWFRFE